MSEAGYSLTEQGIAEWFVHDYGRLWASVPALGIWRRCDEKTQHWEDCRRGDVLDALVRCVKAHAGAARWGGNDPEERQFWRRSLSYRGLMDVVSLLSESGRLALDPDQFDRPARGVLTPGGVYLAEDLIERRSPSHRLMAGDLCRRSMAHAEPFAHEGGDVYDVICSEVTAESRSMVDFLTRALLGSPMREVIVRAGVFDGTFDGLWAPLAAVWGDYIDVLPRSVWLRPHDLPAAWARRIEGARLLFLESAGGNWYGQWEALQVWLRAPKLTYTGVDKKLYPLVPPSGYVLLGSGSKESLIDPGLRPHVWMVPPIAQRAGRRAL